MTKRKCWNQRYVLNRIMIHVVFREYVCQLAKSWAVLYYFCSSATYRSQLYTHIQVHWRLDISLRCRNTIVLHHLQVSRWYESMNVTSKAWLSSPLLFVSYVLSRFQARVWKNAALIELYSLIFSTLQSRSLYRLQTDWVTESQTWNSLPEDVTSSPTLSTFRLRLKTLLIRLSYPDFVSQ